MTIEQWLQIATILGTVITAGIGLIVARMVKTVSINVDGRLTQLLTLTSKSSHAEGMEQERLKERPTTLPPELAS